MPKISRNLMILRRVRVTRRSVKVDTQRMRSKTMMNLEQLFDLAILLAKGEVKTQTENGKTVKVTLKQRQMWARIAAYIAQIMNSIASGFDEREIDTQLDVLERLVNEAKAKTKNGKTQEDPSSPRNANSQGPS